MPYLMRKKKRMKTWSKQFFQSRFGFWNPLSYSNERHAYCKQLEYDVLGLTELHNNHIKKQYQGRRWVCSAPVAQGDDGKNSDPAAGVTILLSNRMADKVLDQGHVGARIVWVKLAGPVCNIFYIVVYVPHKGRTQKPQASDTIAQLRSLLQTANHKKIRLHNFGGGPELPTAKRSSKMHRKIMYDQERKRRTWRRHPGPDE